MGRTILLFLSLVRRGGPQRALEVCLTSCYCKWALHYSDGLVDIELLPAH